LRFAAAVGALAVTKRGAFAAMPTLDEVNIMINEQI
jgi:fructokinase